MRVILAILLLLSLRVCAQQAIKTTLEQCKADLEPTASVESRRSAVLVLGKYDTPEVTAILGKCLSDSDVEVRRSALAALAEQPTRLRAQAPAVLNCILDEDVHIRRHASSLISECMGIFIRGRVQFGPGGRISTGARKGITNAADLVTRGLQDPDAEVRRNVLQGAQCFQVALPLHVLLPLLKDPSDEVVALAIPLAVYANGDSATLREALQPLLTHPNPQIRLTLASELGCRGDMRDMLQTLSRDENQAVRYQALLTRARMTGGDDNGLTNEIVDALAHGALATQDGERLLSALVEVDSERAWRFVQESLLDDGNGVVREAAWMQVVRHREWQERLTTAQVVDALCRYSDNNRIRLMLMSLLRKRVTELTAADIVRLQSSPLVSCRKSVFDLMRNLPAAIQAEALSEALMDDDDDLRLQAVNQLASIRPQGWEALLIATLEDSDARLQQAAAKGLLREMRRNPEVGTALQVWSPKCTDAALRAQIDGRAK